MGCPEMRSRGGGAPFFLVPGSPHFNHSGGNPFGVSTLSGWVGRAASRAIEPQGQHVGRCVVPHASAVLGQKDVFVSVCARA